MPAKTRRQAAIGSATDADGTEPFDVEKHMRNALQGVARLRSQVDNLTRENARLKGDLERIYEAQDVSIQPKPGRKGNVSVLSLTAQVNKLKREIAESEDSRKRDRRKIRKLQLKEVKRDAQELSSEMEYGVRDEAGEMKKLLRRFFELMSSPSMEEKEECAVCLSEMNLESARSLPCQHIFCASCLPNIHPQNCPNCRGQFESVDDAEPVQFTATEQWDALLEVAAEWGRIDNGEPQDDTDREDEIPFIEDDEERSSVTSECVFHAEMENTENGNGGETGILEANHPGSRIRRLALSTPPPDGNVPQVIQAPGQDVPTTPTRVAESSSSSYQLSPVSVKRQRMKELADARKSKRSRW